MNKIIITLIAILVVISAIITAIVLDMPTDKVEVPKSETKIAEEEILDECTEEYEGMEYQNTIRANTQEEKTSPNCTITKKNYFLECGHTKSENEIIAKDFVNLSQEEIQEKYANYKIESFSPNEIVLFQEREGNCEEHYMVKDKEGEVAIYQILSDGTQKEIEITGITTEYLPETDKINMKKGIQVNGKQALNQLIEDFE